MKKHSAKVSGDVLNYLSPMEWVKKGAVVGIVWGEGNSKAPYDKRSFHAGHLSMLCAAVALKEKGTAVTIFMTSDHQARTRRGAFGQFYEQRQKELTNWMKWVTGNRIEVVDVPCRYDIIKSRNPGLWEDAGNCLKDICNGLEKVIRVDNPALDQWAGGLRAARIADDDQEWLRAFNATRAASKIREMLRKHFCDVKYNEKNQDMAATAYVITRVLLENGEKWAPNDIRDWISECGTVLSHDLANGVLVESARNMYWLRCLRLLGNYGARKQGIEFNFPTLARFRNLPNRHGSGAMRSKARDSMVPIFDDADNIHQALSDSQSIWLRDFATRLCWLTVEHRVIKSVSSLITGSHIDDNMLRNGLLSSICFLKDTNNRGQPKDVRIDDWYCCRYFAEHYLKMTPKDMWRHNITEAHVGDTKRDAGCYEALSARLLRAIKMQLDTAEEKLFAAAVYKTVKWTDSIDLVSHMTTKRYRDHGRHQLNVAALVDLLLAASAPAEDYTKAITVADAVAGGEGMWRDSANVLRGMSILAALAHDHGYALLQVAWLLGRLYTMKQKDNPDAITLANALKKYINPFASSWFRHQICDHMTSATPDPCSWISPDMWDALSKGRLGMLMPAEPRLHWPGHGLIGAMNLWGLMDDLSKSKSKKVELSEQSRVLDALRAIALHDINTVPLYMDQELNAKKAEKLDPIAVILAVSDEIQEWNRRMFANGKSIVESPYIELHGIRSSPQYCLQLNSKELQVKFVHKGIAETKVDWEYAYFRSGKHKNFDRVSSTGQLFPKTVTFEMAIGP